MTLMKSALWLIVLQLVAFAGYVSFGWIADRLGRRPSFTMSTIAVAIVVPVFALGARLPLLLLLLGPLVGYFGHGYFSLFGAMLAELFPTRIRATAQGFCYTAGRVLSRRLRSRSARWRRSTGSVTVWPSMRCSSPWQAC